MVVPRFVKQALLGQPLTVFGDGQQTRCFTDVQDAVRCVLALADTPKAIGRIFNIGGSQEVTIQGLAERVIAMTGSTSEIVYLPYEQAYEKGFEDMRRRVPNTTRLRETIGFAPDSDLDTILRRVIDYFQK